MNRNGKRGVLLLSVFFCAVLAQSCANRRTSSAARTEADKQSARIEYAFGPMNPTDASVTAVKLVPFRSVSARGELETLPGIKQRYKGDSVFKLQYADGSELWLVQER